MENNNKRLLVCENSKRELTKMNESTGNDGGYFLEGVFAELDTLNRNKRIYPKDEYLKHLAYLRDDIKKGETLLGELDHPDDRFEVKLKEASHKIVDLWYDANTNCVMGKIELLNTPNGKLAQSLIDQGIPLHISSRAAGTVGNDNKVSIQQIYTYDLVCKPGFAGAVLHRVNESNGTQYNEETNKFLERANRFESMNSAPVYGINESDISIREVSYDATIRKEAASIKENNNDDMNTNTTEENLEEKKKVAPAKPNMKSVFEEGDEKENDQENNPDNENPDDTEKKDGEDNGVEILDVRAETDEDGDEEGVEIEDVKSEEDDKDKGDKDEKNSEDGKDNDEKSEDEKNECKTSECKDGECNDSKGDEAKNADGSECDTKKALFDCKDIKDRKSSFDDKFDKLIDGLKRKDECNKANESAMLNKYPTLCMLNESNRVEVMKLDESQKRNVVAYLSDNNFCTPDSVNENWKGGLEYQKTEEYWVAKAPKAYKELWESMTDEQKASLRENASYFLFENQYDVNNFWESTGLLESEQRRIANEKFINNLPKLNEGVSEDTGLPYSKEFINMVTAMACEYND